MMFKLWRRNDGSRDIAAERKFGVSLDDLLRECLAITRVDGLPIMKLSAIDYATRVLEEITPEMVAAGMPKNPAEVHALIRRRLKAWNEAVKE